MKASCKRKLFARLVIIFPVPSCVTEVVGDRLYRIDVLLALGVDKGRTKVRYGSTKGEQRFGR